jgi:FKBP-type peptidyl-prolyl cis-trans isomerase
VRTPAAFLIAFVVLTTACARTNVDLSNPTARGSYAQGFVIGEQGKGLPLDAEAFMAGVRAGLAGSGELDPEQMQQAMMEFRTLLNEARNVEGAAALAAGETFLAENGRRAGVTTTASGVQYEVLRQGDGPRPEASDRVLVHYRGQRIDGEEFDESYSGGQPATFSVGGVIPGLSEGLLLMQVGSHFKFYIPGHLCYGPNPPPGSIKPNDTLIFEVELIGIE